MATVAHPTNPDVRLAGSQFIVSLGDDTDFLDGKSAIFGRVVEGFDVLEQINEAIVDDKGYPLVDIRINHTVILDDPYPDPDGLVEPPTSPKPSRAQLETARLGEDEQRQIETHELDDDNEERAAEREKQQRERTARAQALTLEVIGDLPSADIAPPENMLFVCKLNPVTQDSDLELIFSRFGKILSCEVIRDHKTGDSLQYAFIEFEDKSSCETAYFKMQDVLIDDRRIHVDFSQSVSKLTGAWWGEKRQKQSRGKGGWGGISELEKWRKYRNEDDDDKTGAAYGMVHDDSEVQGQHATAADNVGGDKDRNESEHADRGGYKGKDGGQYGDRGRDRGGNRGDRDRGRDRDNGRDRGRYNDRRDDRRDDRRGDRRDDRRDGRRRNDDYWDSRDSRDKGRSSARSRSPRPHKSYRDGRDRNRN